MSAALMGEAGGGERRTTSWRALDSIARGRDRRANEASSSLRVENEREFSDSENPWAAKELMVSASRTGCGVTSMPGLSPRVPRMKSEFLGLMQYSSTLILFWVTMP